MSSPAPPVGSVVAPDWFVLEADGLVAASIAAAGCCEASSHAGVRQVAAWTDETGADLGLLVVQRIPVAANEEFAYPHRYFRPQPDGSSWMFGSHGLTDTRRQELADAVTMNSNGFHLSSHGVIKMGDGVLGDGDLRAQAYQSDDGRTTLSVGDYRGQFESFIEAESIVPTTVAGVPALEATLPGRGIIVAWAVRDEWATLEISPTLVHRKDELIDSVVASNSPPTIGPSIATSELEDQYVATAIVLDTPERGPMIALGLDGSMPPQGNGIPIEHWDWSAVPGDRSAGATRWGGPYEIVGTWSDGAFQVTQPPRPATVIDPVPPSAPTPGCDEASLLPILEALGEIAARGGEPFVSQPTTFDGRCGIEIVAVRPSPGLDDSLSGFAGDIVSEKYVLEPVT